MGLSFGAFMTFFFVTQFGLFPGFVGGVLSGVLFGAVMAACYGVLYRRREGKLKLGDVHHEATIPVAASKKDAFEACKKSLNHLGRRIRITKEDSQSGELRTRAAMEWSRPADVISFSVRELDDQSSEIEVESKPWIPTVITDQGSNLKNIEAIKAYFESHGLLTDQT
jgi:hypothetical protein